MRQTSWRKWMQEIWFKFELIEMNSNSDQNKTPFNKLLNNNWDYVFNYILKKTSDDYVAEEITIQTFSKAFQKIKLYDKKFSFSEALQKIKEASI